MDKSAVDITWVLICGVLVFGMQGGFLCLEAGMTRTKNAINVAVKNLADFGVAVVLFWAIGFGIMFGITNGGWIGSSLFFAPVGQGDPWLATFFMYQVVFCGTAVTIISGAVAERLRFVGYLVVAALVSGLVYPVFGHWAWGGVFQGPAGWLADMGFVDFAGSTVVHGVGGWAALAVLMIIGSREGRFSEDGTGRNIPGSNLPLAMLGVLLLWLGWLGFNGGSTFGMTDQVPGIIANTMLAAGSGLVTTLFIGMALHKHPEPSLVMNGALAGLVAITASVFAVEAGEAVIIGFVGGLVMMAAQRVLERFRVDDVVGAVPVHLAAGVWGTIAVALFGDPQILGTGLSRLEQLQVQVIGIGVCGLVAFGAMWVLLQGFNRILPLRISREQEAVGLNVAEHGATTEILDFLTTMDTHARTQDIRSRVPEEPFTEIGQIAKQYNRVMDSLERERQSTVSLMQEQTLLRAEAHRAEKLAAIGQVSGGIAHDLRNPLGAIRNAIYLLNRRLASAIAVQDNPQIDKCVQIIDKEVDRADNIITDLMSFAQAKEPVLCSTDLCVVIEDCLSSVKAEAGVEILTELAPGPVTAMADRDLLYRVFMNLINNAREAMPDGGRLTVSTRNVGEFVEAKFKDTGNGISQESIEKIFEPLFTTKIKGTGFGLSVCKDIVGAHGGAIEVANNPGEDAGVTFTVRIPRTVGGPPVSVNGT